MSLSLTASLLKTETDPKIKKTAQKLKNALKKANEAPVTVDPVERDKHYNLRKHKKRIFITSSIPKRKLEVQNEIDRLKGLSSTSLGNDPAPIDEGDVTVEEFARCNYRQSS